MVESVFNILFNMASCDNYNNNKKKYNLVQSFQMYESGYIKFDRKKLFKVRW